MTIEEAKKYAKSIDLTVADKRSFEDFQPLAEQMKAFLDNNDTVIMTGSEVRNIIDRDVTQFTLSPVDSDTKPVNLVLAFNNRNIYVDGVSLKALGEKDIDSVMPALAAFIVKSVNLTGEWPMRRSIAAQELGLVPSPTLTDAQWSSLRKKYEGDADMRKAATDEAYDARLSYEIPHIEISPIE